MDSTLSGASFTSVDPNSGVEYDVSATSGTGGETLFRTFLANTDDGREFDLSNFFKETGDARNLSIDAFGTTQNVLTIYGVNESAGSCSMRASFAWRET